MGVLAEFPLFMQVPAPGRRHRHQSSGRDRRTSTNNRSRNLHEQGELSQDIQQRDTTRTNPEPVPEMPTSTKIPAGQFMDHEDRVRKPAMTADRAQQRQAEREEARVRTHAKQRDQAPTIPEPTTKIPASQYMDHEDRRRKPATTADRRQRRKSERGEAREKAQSKGRQKQTLLEKLAGPLLIPGLPRSRRTSPERGDGPAAVRGGGQKFQTLEDGNSSENRNKPEDPDPEPVRDPDQEAAGNQTVQEIQKIREKLSYAETVSGKPGAPPGQKAHIVEGDLKKDKKGQSFTLNLRAGSKARIGAGKFHAIRVKGIKENLTFKDCWGKKVSLSPTLKKKGLRISRIFDRKIDGETQLWMILKNTNSNFHFQVCRGQRLAELDRRSNPGY